LAKGKWDEVKARFDEIKKWLYQGLYEKDIIKNLNIGKTTWEGYKNKNPELKALLLLGRQNQNEEVTNSLYKNATGFYFFVDEVIKLKDSDGGEYIQTVSVKKFKPPETDAAKYWLKNRAKKLWADNPQMIDLKREEFEYKKQTEKEFGEW